LWAFFQLSCLQLRGQAPLADPLNPGADGVIHALAVQSDGRILVGGSFRTLGGQPRRSLGRLHPDGSLDLGFDPGVNGTVNAIQIQADGGILVGGELETLGGQFVGNLGRLHPDGTVDTQFGSGGGFGGLSSVYALGIQADGKIVVGGDTRGGGFEPQQNLIRLHADGTWDDSLRVKFRGGVETLAIQADGSILAGGQFMVQQVDRDGDTIAYFNLIRVGPGGALDQNFYPDPDGGVSCLAVQQDGRILLSGSFSKLDVGNSDIARRGLGRIDRNGNVDTSFNPALDGSVNSMVVQTDGRILLGGYFNRLGGQPRSRIGRLNANGTADTTFNPGADGTVQSLAVQTDGRILVGGDFATLGGQGRSRIGRIQNTTPAAESLNFAGSTITWLRGDTSPEVSRPTFEYTTDGVRWTSVAATRITGGWQRTGVSVPVGTPIRARGYVAGGLSGSSGWIVESHYGRPSFVLQPASRTNDLGSLATLRAVVSGASGFRWLKNGNSLQDQGNVSGTATPTLALSSVSKADEGAYRLVLTNRFGSVTSVVATLSVRDPYIRSQPANASRDVGQSVTFSVDASGSTALGYQWHQNGKPLPGAVGPSLTLAAVSAADAGSYTVVVSSSVGTLTSTPAWLTVNTATLEVDFHPAASAQHVNALAVQTDGKILVGGRFALLGNARRNYFGRLNADGSIDRDFDVGADQQVNSVALQMDGKILVGGFFTTLGGQPRSRLARVNADGTVDASFNPVARGEFVSALAVQADGRILVGGSFTNLGGQPRQSIGRLNTNGTIDATFNPGTGGWLNSLAVQTDGRILLGGFFTNLGGQPVRGLVRLNANGTIDSAFNPVPEGEVLSMAVQADGRTLVGGRFATLAGQSRAHLARLLPNGTLDTTFNPGANALVVGMALQTDGRILIGGNFSEVAGQARPRMARLNSDGTLDTSFDPGARIPGLGINVIAVQPDGRILVGGARNPEPGSTNRPLARLSATEPALQSLNYAGTTLTWLRGGSSPEITRARFESTTNGTVWSDLGEGTRMAGGWQKTGVRLPANATVRARGPVAGDGYGSGWFAESLYGALRFVSQPAHRTNDFQTEATFTVVAIGGEPLRYTWLKNGVALEAGGNISGVNSPTLTLTRVTQADQGAYSVLVSSSQGNATSASATLTVNAEVLDSSFSPADLSSVSAVAVQTDGQILLGGGFFLAAGQLRSQIARFQSDGKLDIQFNPGADNTVLALALQPDGKILVGGTFSTLGSQSRNYLGRLHADGTLDTAFAPRVTGRVFCLVVQEDGRILVGGEFTSLGGQERRYLGRLLPDGQLDTTFNPGAGAAVHSLALQADGKIVVGGVFTALGSQTRNRIGRLHPDGRLDETFNPGVSGPVHCLAVQADGGLLVGGVFTNLASRPRASIGRLLANGILDNTFDPGADGLVQSIAIQSNGKILVGGSFNTLGGQQRGRLGRLHPDGTVDGTFRADASGPVHGLALQTDGRVLVGGSFRTLAGQARSGVARLLSTEPSIQTLSLNGSNLTWMRGGGGPEVWRTTFEVTADSSTWTDLGAGTRIPGGWQRTGVALPARGRVRARGYAVGGEKNGSGSVVEASFDFGPPLLASQPQSQTHRLGSTATFSVATLGDGPFTFQWLKDGAPLTDQGNASGVTSATLVLSRVALADAGSYSVVVSNASGSVTSSPAILTIFSGSTRLDGLNLGIENTPYGSIESLVEQPNGKILVGGLFKTVASETLQTLTRLNPDGTPDPGFSARPGIVNSMVLQPDGKILVGSNGRWSGQEWLDTVLRLNHDGAQDAAFQPEAVGEVFAMALQPDGRILVGGDLTRVGGQPRRGIARLHSNGTLDASFDPGADSTVNCLALQEDGNILVGGSFTNLAGQVRRGIARLQPDGTLDPTFDPGVGGHFPIVSTLLVQPDRKIVVGGWFWSLAGKPRNYLGRLNPDGTLDEGFNPGAEGAVHALALQANGQVLVGGWFKKIGGQSHSFLARLKGDGTLDPFFEPIVDAEVRALALQADGRILVGGYFTKVAGQARSRIARLENNEPATQTLSRDGGLVSWMRGGSSPEVGRTTLESSSDGSTWTDLGAGTRVPNGWQWAGVALPPNATVRARGSVTSGFQNGSGGWVETLLSPGPALHLTVVRDGPSLLLQWTGGKGPYQVQAASDLGAPEPWQDLGSPLQGQSVTVPLGPGTQFLRVRQP
jgi:uncharacterized delta-60 repeat protein